MSYIGNTPTTQAFTAAIDYFSGNGMQTAFTLSRPVASAAQIQVVIENVPQNPSSAFTVTANVITFTSAPPVGTNNIYVYYTSPITQVIAPSDGTVTTADLAPGITIPLIVQTPVNQSPAVGATGVYDPVTMTGSNFYALYNYTQSASQWQISTDPAFNTVTWDSGLVGAVTTYSKPYGVLATSTLYYWRCRYRASDGTYSAWSTPTQFTTAASFDYTVNYLLVAGGGGGGNAGLGGSEPGGGGGGAGGALVGSFTTLAGVSYPIVIGGGGAGGSGGNNTPGSTGSNSTFYGLTALGGGLGGGRSAGGNGGSGGGGGNGSGGGTGTSGQGTNGSGSSVNQGGGGGGKTAAGGLPNGGNGVTGPIPGVAGSYAGGGGGGYRVGYAAGTGGVGGGGAGGNGGGTSGTANTGGGGGGTSGGTSGSGGSGVVVISYLGPQRGTGGTVTSSGGYTIHTFTTSGTYIT